MIAGNPLDKFRLSDPLRISADLVLGHRRERVHLYGEATHNENFGDKVNEGKKRGAPRLNEQDAAVLG